MSADLLQALPCDLERDRAARLHLRDRPWAARGAIAACTPIALSVMPNSIRRCHWVGEDPLYFAHHDREWAFPVADDRRPVRKDLPRRISGRPALANDPRQRKAFREAFFGFDFERVARFGARDVSGLLRNPGNRPAPRQDRIDDQQRKARPRIGGGIRLARRVLLAVRAQRKGAAKAADP